MCIENKELKKFISQAFDARECFSLPSMKEGRRHQRIFVNGLIRAYRISCKEIQELQEK